VRRIFITFYLAVFTVILAAQPPADFQVKPKQALPKATLVAPQVLPVHKVVLYKNGVGYFEHVGSVTGNQRVAIDFTSSQLNDVLQSLTVFDEGGGRISGVNYNSTTPLVEQLKSLSLGMTDDPTSTELFQALRGQRVEVTGGPGGAINGRLMSIELRTEKSGVGDNTTLIDKYYLTLVVSSGAVRVIELTPALSVRPLDANLQGQLDRYLELLAATHANGLRHLTLNALGQGQRELRVSYISEVPVWKSTYRLVFPRTANGNATIQGWAVVDNTVGADWDNVQLSFVAGAPQSFIQPLSQPIYMHRPEIPIATGEQLTPQMHEAAENDKHVVHVQSEMMSNQLTAPTRISRSVKMDAEKEVAPPASFGVAGAEFGGSADGKSSPFFGDKAKGVNRASDAYREGDVFTNAFDDFFEYSLTQPVTIHKNESAMVPILQQELPAEHVTLWSEKEKMPLRAVWLKNTSKMTLDSGSFSIFESGEFAGEGLLDPIHPGEKRLLSYAADQAVKVHQSSSMDMRTLHHIAMHEGVLVEQSSEVVKSTYTVNNAADETRTVLIEHARHGDAVLDSELKPAETTPTAYRFRVVVAPHESVDLHLGEQTTLAETVRIDSNFDRSGFLISVSKLVPSLEEKLRPLIEAEIALNSLNRRIQKLQVREKTLVDDEARDRENLTALKGNDTSKRFVEELNHAEDAIEAVRREKTAAEKDLDAARAHLETLIGGLSFDEDASVVMNNSQPGERPLR
jgi:hypothetical protein